MNIEQQQYINSLSYDFGGVSKLDDIVLSDSFREKLSKVSTLHELIVAIRDVNCFGLKDDIIVSLLE